MSILLSVALIQFEKKTVINALRQFIHCILIGDCHLYNIHLYHLFSLLTIVIICEYPKFSIAFLLPRIISHDPPNPTFSAVFEIIVTLIPYYECDD